MDVGVCYFPEHWPRDRWRADVEAMAEAGIEYVRMGEFAWSRLEPEPGAYAFDWLERVVDLLGEHGMQAVLCTPTATPPKWLVDRHPEIHQEEPDGTGRGFGSRRHYCFNSPAYREETERIVSRLAEHFAGHPYVAGWQTDNEFGCHDTVRCYCEDCAAAFREWLREKYGDVDSLNKAWGTTFWSQHHTAFEEVDPPRHTPAEHHPARLLDYHRFASDSVVAYNRLQTEILRAADDEWFCTHNFMYDFSQLDPVAVGADLDFAAWDSYPTGFPQVSSDRDLEPADLRVGHPDELGRTHDLYRCAADGPFWVMEQQPGEINWPPVSSQPADGAMRLWAHHAVAHGADVVSYFRWRRCLEGQEQYHAGLRRADGSPGRGYDDATVVAGEFATLGDLPEPEGQVACCLDYDSLWALEEQPVSPDFDYWAHLHTYYAALRARGVTVDVVPPTAALEGYDAVVAPALHVLDDETAEVLASFVRDGGSLLVTIRTGEKTPGNRLRETAPPGPLAAIVGASVTEHESVDRDLFDATVTYCGELYGYRTWAEWLAVEAPDASAVGEYAAGVGEGRTAIVDRDVGEGSVTYVGVWPGRNLADALVSDLLERAGVGSVDRLPDRVRLAERGGFTWVCNFSSDPVDLDLAADVAVRIGEVPVPGYDLAVLEGTVADVTVST